MPIQDKFNQIAQEYDANRRKFIPCFDSFYEQTTDFIAKSMPPPKKVLDLGAGTGLLSYYWALHFPKALYTLVDLAEKMLEVAKKRFHAQDNISYKIANYAKDFDFPGYDAVISALSIHHLSDEDKKQLFKNIYEALPKGGVFANYDQFHFENEKIENLAKSYWENGIVTSGLSQKDIASWRQRQTLDIECCVKEELEMLRCYFSDVECVFLQGKFAVIVAQKN